MSKLSQIKSLRSLADLAKVDEEIAAVLIEAPGEFDGVFEEQSIGDAVNWLMSEEHLDNEDEFLEFILEWMDAHLEDV